MRAAIVLAAGQSRRFGRADKLFADLAGAPLLLHALRAARAAPVGRVIVVAGRPARVRALVRESGLRGVRVVPSAQPGAPLSTSLRTAVTALRPIERDAFIFLGDMPQVDPGMAARLVRQPGKARITRPRHRGIPGHPVLARGIRSLPPGRGDAGLGGGGGQVTWVRSGGHATADIDRRRDLARARRRFAGA